MSACPWEWIHSVLKDEINSNVFALVLITSSGQIMFPENEFSSFSSISPSRKVFIRLLLHSKKPSKRVASQAHLAKRFTWYMPMLAHENHRHEPETAPASIFLGLNIKSDCCGFYSFLLRWSPWSWTPNKRVSRT